MKILSPLKILGLLVVCLALVSSCDNGELDDLEKRIEELESQLIVKDSVLLSDLEISSQESMDIMTDRGITNILGSLSIRNCVDLTPLRGLKSVEGLFLEIPVGLNSLEGLNDLSGVNYLDIYFRGNSSVDLSALDGLETVSDISLGGTLPSISWFNNISILSSLNIYAELPTLIFSGFEKLESIDHISIYNGSGNLDIHGFDNLKSLQNLYLSAVILTVSGFDSIIALNSLNLDGNTLKCSGLNGISALGFLSLSGRSLDISGLNGITFLNSLSFYGHTLDVSGLASLKSVKTLDVFIENSATGLNYIETVDEYLNLVIGSCDDFLTGLISAGRLNVSTYSSPSDHIKSFSDLGLTNLKNIGGLSLDIPSLESLDGFDFSNSTLVEFSTYNCPNLVDISAMSTYSGPIYFFTLYGTALTSLDGLENVTQFTDIWISDNSQLNDWCAIKSVLDNVIGDVVISGNASNPQSSADITGCN